jgi:hypothetical protein
VVRVDRVLGRCRDRAAGGQHECGHYKRNLHEGAP